MKEKPKIRIIIKSMKRTKEIKKEEIKQKKLGVFSRGGQQ